MININNKSINRILAESLFNLAKSKEVQVTAEPGQETQLFELIEGTSSSTSGRTVTIEDTIQFFEIPPVGTDIYIKFR